MSAKTVGYRWPLWHWATGLVICAALGLGFLLGAIFGASLS